jgi:hypothetical protein
MGEVQVAPALIVRRFGLPGPGDDYKVSGEYVFIDQNGEPFVVHDWKSTSLCPRIRALVLATARGRAT